VPIITHTDHGSLGDKQPEIFLAEGVKPNWAAIGHLTTAPTSRIRRHPDKGVPPVLTAGP
jgi:predicted metal-dependent phosphotriesterase family hydrolase